MAIPNFFQQSQQAMQQGMQLGSAFRNAQAMDEQRQFAKQMQPYEIEEAEQQSQLRPLELRQQKVKTNDMEREDLQKSLTQDALFLASMSEDAGKKYIPELINKYEGKTGVESALNALYKTTGTDYIQSTQIIMGHLTGKGGEKESNFAPTVSALQQILTLVSNTQLLLIEIQVNQ